MIYIRGHARDYDGWRQMGLPGWSFADVLPYFKRSEHNEKGGDDFHGGEGPLRVSSGRSTNPLFRAFTEAGREAGFPQTAGLQRLSAGRLRPLPAHDSRRRTLERGQGLSDADPEPQESHHRIPCACLAHPVRRQARHRRRVHPEQAACARGRQPRGAALRRRRELAPDASAVRHRRSRDAEALRHSGAGGPEGRRQEPAGSSRRLDPV